MHFLVLLKLSESGNQQKKTIVLQNYNIFRENIIYNNHFLFVLDFILNLFKYQTIVLQNYNTSRKNNLQQSLPFLLNFIQSLFNIKICSERILLLLLGIVCIAITSPKI